MNKKIYGYPAVGISYYFMKELSFELDLKGSVAVFEAEKGEKVFWAEGVDLQRHKGVKNVYHLFRD